MILLSIASYCFTDYLYTVFCYCMLIACVVFKLNPVAISPICK